MRKLIPLLIVATVFLVAGYQYAAALYEADIATLKEDYARRAQTL